MPVLGSGGLADWRGVSSTAPEKIIRGTPSQSSAEVSVTSAVVLVTVAGVLGAVG